MTPRRPVTAVQMTAVRHGRATRLPDTLVTEEPLQLQVAGPGQAPEPLTVTMRTPGHDFELAAGFLLAEAVIDGHDDVAGIRYCELEDGQEQQYNVVTVRLRRRVHLDGAARRFTTTSSCGICGTATLEQLERRCRTLPPGPPFALSVLVGLPDAMRPSQRIFARTGGLHAAALFGRDGTLRSAREDVGRHNAVDKLVGAELLADRLPLADCVLAVSGRVSFELVQKAAVAGIPVLCAVSAPSSLAVETAERVGMTVVGFVRAGRANVYTHPERVEFDL